MGFKRRGAAMQATKLLEHVILEVTVKPSIGYTNSAGNEGSNGKSHEKNQKNPGEDAAVVKLNGIAHHARASNINAANRSFIRIGKRLIEFEL
jgi:hypothetical protein